MTEAKQTKTVTSKAPSHIAYQVREGKEPGKSYWTRIGSVWPHTDGKGLNVQIKNVPLDGRITLLIVSENVE